MVANFTTVRTIDDNIKTDLGLKEGIDVIPKQVLPTIQPIYEVLRRVCNFNRAGSFSDSTGGTFFSTPTDRDFYVTAVQLTYSKDAINTATFVNLGCTVNGATVNLARIRFEPLTAGNDHQEISFPFPIKIDRGTNVTGITDNGTASIDFSGALFGYTNLPSQPERITL